MGQRIGYQRVSTVDQNTDRQLDGVEMDKVFTDKASGKDTNRPELGRAIDYVRDGDTLVVHSMDRLARNLEDLRRIVREHGGEMAIESSEGKGVTLTIRLPLRDQRVRMLESGERKAEGGGAAANVERRIREG